MRIPALRAVCATSTLALAAGLVIAAPAGAADAAAEVYRVPSDGVFRMEGSGWGHGRGMSQWGAYQAASEGRSHSEILSFYYPGTVLATLPATQVRVLLSTDTGRNLIVRATRGLTAQQAGSKPFVLPTKVKRCKKRITRWRARARGSKMTLDAYCKRWRKVRRVSGQTLTFANPDGLVSTQSRQVRRGYRGTVTATKTGRRSLRVVNTVPMEQYLRPVVAAEVSPSWPEESLLAQAVAARSYAAHEALGRAGKPFDVYDVIRSQAYPGAVQYNRKWRVIRDREHARTDAAIRATAGLHVTAGGQPALTQFSSSNGGATASTPLPYMRVALDEWDARATKNPRLSWTDSVSASSLARRYPSAGRIRAIEVLSREGAGNWGGRITALRIVGDSRSYTVRGDSAIRSVLGVNSSFLTFTS
jgi:stage II sporulation protein D